MKTREEKLKELNELFDEADRNQERMLDLIRERKELVKSNDFLGIMEINSALEDLIVTGIMIDNDICRISKEIGYGSEMESTIEPYITVINIIIKLEKRFSHDR